MTLIKFKPFLIVMIWIIITIFSEEDFRKLNDLSSDNSFYYVWIMIIVVLQLKLPWEAQFLKLITFPSYGSDNGNYSNGKMSMIMIIVMVIITMITKTAIVNDENTTIIITEILMIRDNDD